MSPHNLPSHRDDAFADRWLPRLLAGTTVLLALLVPFGSARAALLASGSIPSGMFFVNFAEPTQGAERLRMSVAGEVLLDTGYASGDVFTIALTQGNAFDALVTPLTNSFIGERTRVQMDHDYGTLASTWWANFYDTPSPFGIAFPDLGGVPIGGVVLRLDDICLDLSNDPSVDPCGFGGNAFGHTVRLTMELHDSAFGVPTPGTLSLAGLALLAASAVRRRPGHGRVRDHGA